MEHGFWINIPSDMRKIDMRKIDKRKIDTIVTFTRALITYPFKCAFDV